MKFATKLTVTMSGILIFFAAIVSYVVYKSNIETLENQIKGRQMDAAQHIMDKIDRMLFERLADIKVIASDPIVSSRDSTPRQIRERLSAFRNYHKTYISISLFDLNRVRIADTSGLDIGIQHPLNGYWEDIVVGEDFIMDVSESVSLKQTVIHFGFPVKDKSGETFGIVITRTPVSKLYYIIREIGSTQTEREEWQIDLMDKDGLLLYSNYNRKGILKDNMTEWEIVRNSLANREISTGRFLHGEIEDIYVFVHEQGYLDFKGNDWNLLVHVPTRVAFAPAVKLRNIMFSIMAAVLVFSILILFLLSRTLTRPIIKLRDATIRVGRGDRDIKLNINTKDEIGELANSFIQMNNNLLETTVARNELIEEISERKKIEEELQESKRRYQAVSELTSDFIYHVRVDPDKQMTVDWITDGFAKLTGYSFEEVKYPELWKKVLHPDDISDFMEYFKKLIIGNTEETEVRIITKRNKTLLFHIYGQPEWDNKKQNVIGIVGAGSNITERRWIEEQNEIILQTTHDGFWLVDVQGRIIDVNDAYCSLSGYSRDELLKMCVSDVAAKEKPVETERHNLQKIGKGGIRFESTHVCKDGRIINVEVSTIYENSQGGRFFSFFRDITKRKRAENMLRVNNSFLKLLQVAAVTANEAVETKDAFQPILEEICRYTDWPIGHAYVISKDNPHLLEPTKVWWFKEEKRFAKFRKITEETVFLKGIGLPGRVLASGKPHWIKDVTKNGNFIRTKISMDLNINSGIAFPVMVGNKVVAVLEFFTVEKAEPDQQFIKIMADVGTQLGRAIERKQAEEQIRASLKEKELLLNEIHHRVKNSLQLISSFLDLSSMETGDQNTIDLLTECRNRIDSMSIIHSQLYKSERFDRIDMGKHAHELSQRLLQIYAMEKTIELDIKCNNVCLAIDKAIPCALILNELISNVLKHAYCNKEKGTLCISIQIPSNGNLIMSVKDDGVGIPEELDINRSRSLGLTLVRNLVYKQLKGNMQVMRNGGTEFIIDFKNLENKEE